MVYQSKSGYTKRYIEMLAGQVEGTMVELKAVSATQMTGYGVIVYAGGVYAGKISGIKKFFRLLGSSSPQKIALVAVGAAPLTSALREKLMQDNLTAETVTSLVKPKFFYLQGGFDPDKLNIALKAMLGMMSKNLQKKQMKTPDKITEEEQGFLDFFQVANDQTSEEQLAPLVAYLKL
jgi:menaquinone-dependent protoporphyrinogen IX oxidase